MALTTHIPVMSTVASLLQAVLACPSARRMLLSSRPVDDRVSQGLSGYSSGRSPADIRYREDDQYHGLEQSVRGDFETMWRAQILAAFCLLTDNAVCDIGDMSVDVPQDTLRKASRSDTLVEVALCEFSKAAVCVTSKPADPAASAPSLLHTFDWRRVQCATVRRGPALQRAPGQRLISSSDTL